MKKTAALFIVMILSGVMVFVVAQNKKSTKKVWRYEVPQAPYGYDKGKIILTNDSNVLTGEVEIKSGYIVKMRDVTLVNDTLKGGVYIENELVRLQGNVKDSIIVGTVDTSMGKMNFRAKKEASSH